MPEARSMYLLMLAGFDFCFVLPALQIIRTAVKALGDIRHKSVKIFAHGVGCGSGINWQRERPIRRQVAPQEAHGEI